MNIKFFRVLELPQELLPAAFYYVKNGDVAEGYLTDANAIPYLMGNSELITRIVNTFAVENIDPGDLTVYIANALI